MKNFNNELVVHRNETFTIDKIIQNKDGSPYVISSALENPYFLLTVTSNKYQQTNRYIKNYWLSLQNYPRFAQTKAINLKGLLNGAGDTIHNWNDVKVAGTILGDDEEAEATNDVEEAEIIDEVEDDTEDTQYYVAAKEIDEVITDFYTDTDAIYYLNGEYKYCEIATEDTENVSVGDIIWHPYELHIIKTFLQEDTGKWVEQSYSYSIQLVSGDTPSDEQPITNFDTVITLLPPTKLTVLSNLHGGM